MNNKKIIKITSGILLCTMLAYTTPIFAYTKEETVYSKLDADGTNYNTIVNTHIKNTEKTELINDITDLINIENVNGDQKYSQEGDNLIWNADGEDIYYSGNTDKKLPIECRIKYELNGEEISRDDIIGKSGNVRVIIEYTNNELHKIDINGKTEDMYTPFVVIIGTIINNEENRDIKISSGKLIDNGSKTIAVGMAFPGVQESLKTDDITFPNKIEIEMESTNFEMNNIISFASTNIFEEEDIDKLDDVDKVFSKINELQDASLQLVDGTNQLKNGAAELNLGANILKNELNEKIDMYKNAKQELLNKQELETKITNFVNQEMQKMLPELEKEAQKEAQEAIKRHKQELENSTVVTTKKYTSLALQEKLEELEKNNYKVFSEKEEEALTDALTKIVQQELNKINNNPETKAFLTALENAVKEEENKIKDKTKSTVTTVIDNKKASLDALKALESLPVASQDAYISKNFSAYEKQILAVQAQSGNKLSKLEALETIVLVSNSTLDTVKVEVNKKIDGVNIQGNSEIKVKIEKAVDEYIQNITLDIMKAFNLQNKEQFEALETKMKDMIIKDLSQMVKKDETIQGLNKKIEAEVNTTIDTVATKVATELSKNYTLTLANEITKNMLQNHFSKNKISNSEIDIELSKYESIINEKLQEVDIGLVTLEDALNQLTNGTKSLQEGANTLFNGMTKFNEDGIEKICSKINGDARDLKVRAEKLAKLSLDYNNYTKIEENQEGRVQFIFITDALKSKQKEDKQEAIIQENKNKIVEE